MHYFKGGISMKKELQVIGYINRNCHFCGTPARCSAINPSIRKKYLLCEKCMAELKKSKKYTWRDR
jgi:hypothetical protein